MRPSVAVLLAVVALGCDASLGARRDGSGGDGGFDAARAEIDGARPDTGDAAVGDAAVGDAAVDDAAVDDAAVDDAAVADGALDDAASIADAFSLPCPGGPGELDLRAVTLYSNPPTLADWPVTTTLTEIDFTEDGVHVEFSALDGPGRWPDIVPPGWDGPLQYTLGMVQCIDGAWHGSAVIQFWYGLEASGGNVARDAQVAVNWYYDAIRWGRLAGRQPATGELIGIFVAAGNLRNITTDDPAQSPVMERSNVVLVPMPDVSGAMHSF